MIDLTRPMYDVVADRIENELTSILLDGGKLPAVRWLMKKYDVSQATIDRSLQILKDRECIERIPNRGYFCKKFLTNAVEHPNIDFCFIIKEEDLSNNILFNAMCAKMLTEMNKRSCQMNVYTYKDNGDVNQFKKRVNRSRPDVLLVLGCANPALQNALDELRIGHVQIYPNILSVNCLQLVINNRKAVELGVDHLCALGHERIAFLHGQGASGFYLFDQAERLDAFHDLMQEKKLSTGGGLVRYAGFTPKEGYVVAKELLALPTDKRPTAIFCNDYNAPGVYDAARELKIEIPQELSVMGFDNILPLESLTPRLTTIDILWQDTVINAANKAVQICRGESIERTVFRQNVTLVVNDSTGPVNNL